MAIRSKMLMMVQKGCNCGSITHTLQVFFTGKQKPRVDSIPAAGKTKYPDFRYNFPYKEITNQQVYALCHYN